MDVNKLRTALRYWYEGKGYFRALEAMNIAIDTHTGFRKDGVTPEIHHQISLAGYLKTLTGGLIEEEDSHALAWLHDVQEDYPHVYGALSTGSIAMRYVLTGEAQALNKNLFPNKEAYYKELVRFPTTSIVKGVDRIHNFQTMPGVFTVEKQISYIAEGETYVIPMLKQAIKNHPEQTNAYYNVIHMLRTQIELLRITHER